MTAVAAPWLGPFVSVFSIESWSEQRCRARGQAVQAATFQYSLLNLGVSNKAVAAKDEVTNNVSVFSIESWSEQPAKQLL